MKATLAGASHTIETPDPVWEISHRNAGCIPVISKTRTTPSLGSYLSGGEHSGLPEQWHILGQNGLKALIGGGGLDLVDLKANV